MFDIRAYPLLARLLMEQRARLQEEFDPDDVEFGRGAPIGTRSTDGKRVKVADENNPGKTKWVSAKSLDGSGRKPMGVGDTTVWGKTGMIKVKDKEASDPSKGKWVPIKSAEG